ncbi:MAG: IS200/IS605 family transposase [Candidatus Hodarchaeales archaeon]
MCIKYRIKVITFTDKLKLIFKEIRQRYQWIIRGIEIIFDHVHLFITTPSFDAPSKIFRLRKGLSTRKCFQIFPSLCKELGEDHLWSPSYYCGIAGTVSSKVIQKYIISQKTIQQWTIPPLIEIMVFLAIHV